MKEERIKKLHFNSRGELLFMDVDPSTDWWLKQANKYDYKKSNQKFVAILERKGYPPAFIKANIDSDGNGELITPKTKSYPSIKDLFDREEK